MKPLDKGSIIQPVPGLYLYGQLGTAGGCLDQVPWPESDRYLDADKVWQTSVGNG